MSKRFFKCDLCGNMVGLIHASGVPMICCGQPMTELIANTTDAAQEKHVPFVKIEDGLVQVQVGEVAHPMLEEHHIEWIYLQTEQGGQRKGLRSGMEPVVTFRLVDGDRPIAAFEYCNLHGLWKKDL